MNMHPHSLIDRHTVRDFLAIVHAQAARALEGATDPGFLQLGRIHPTGGAYLTEHFAIGDVDGMFEQACNHAESGFNTYVEARTVGPVAKGKRGSEADTRGVFALVIDDDADKAKGCAGIAGASLIVETSPGNRHQWLFLDKALPPTDAKPLGVAIARATKTDATGRITQPYRVAGTPNYPDARKEARGRVMEPTRIIRHAKDELWSPDRLRAAFPQPETKESPDDDATRRASGGGGVLARLFIDARLSRPVPQGEDRSAAFQSAVNEAVTYASMTPEIFEELARAKPDGCAAKFLNPDRLRQEISRSWPKGVEDYKTRLGEGAADHARRQQEDTDNEGWDAPPKDAPEWPRIVSSRDFVAGFTPPDYLVDGLVQRRFVYSNTGPTGGGKTALTLFLTKCVALGLPFGGCETPQGRVLFMAGENPDDIRMRWLLLAHAEGFNVNDIDVHFIPGVFSLTELGDKVRAEVAALGGVSLVIIDTSAAYFEGKDENGNKEAGDHARLIRSFTTLEGGPTVIVNCHPVKNAGPENMTPRGGGAFIAEMDGNLTSVRTDAMLTLHWQGKFRGPDFAPITFELVTGTTPELTDSRRRSIPSVYARALSRDEERNKAQEARSDEDEVLLLLLHSEGDMTPNSIASALKWLMKTGELYRVKASRVLKKLSGEKLVTLVRGNPTLTELGKKQAKKVDYNRKAAGASYG